MSNAFEQIKEMIRKVLNINQVGSDGKRLLDHAIELKNVEVVRLLVEDHRAELNYTDYKGDTPIHNAVASDDLEIVKILVENGKEYLNCSNFMGEAPLHNAVRLGNIKIVQYLVKEAADLNHLNFMGNTPLHNAAVLNRIQIIKHFLQAGADMKAKNGLKQTAFELAIGCNFIESTCLFIYQMVPLLMDKPDLLNDPKFQPLSDYWDELKIRWDHNIQLSKNEVVAKGEQRIVTLYDLIFHKNIASKYFDFFKNTYKLDLNVEALLNLYPLNFETIMPIVKAYDQCKKAAHLKRDIKNPTKSTNFCDQIPNVFDMYSRTPPRTIFFISDAPKLSVKDISWNSYPMLDIPPICLRIVSRSAPCSLSKSETFSRATAVNPRRIPSSLNKPEASSSAIPWSISSILNLPETSFPMASEPMNLSKKRKDKNETEQKKKNRGPQIG